MNTISAFLAGISGDRWARLFITLVVCVMIARGIRALILRNVEDPEIRYRAGKTITGLTWIGAVLIIVGSFSGSLTGVLTSLSVIGAGIAFALQEVIASIAGRVAVLTGHFYRIGDRVQLGGIKGDVIDIGLLRTTIMEIGDWVKGDLYTGRVVRVANSFVFKEPVYNYSGDFEFLWDEITLPVTYGVNHTEARAMLTNVVHEVAGEYVAPAAAQWREMLAKYRVENARVQPMVSLVLNDNWMEFTVRYVVPFDKRRTVKDLLFTRIMDEVNNSSGAIRLASATSAIVEFPTVDVRMIREPRAAGSD